MFERSLLAAALALVVAADTAASATFTLPFTVTQSITGDTGAPSTLFVGDTGFVSIVAPSFGTGVETFDPTSGLTVSVDIFGQTFTEVDDRDFDFNPFLRLVDGAVSYFEFNVDSLGGCCGGNPTDFLDPRVLAFSLVGGEITGFDDNFEAIYADGVVTSLSATATVVPLPPAAALMAGALALAAAVGRRRRA